MAMTPHTRARTFADKLREHQVKVVGGVGVIVLLIGLLALPMVGDGDEDVVEFAQADDQESAEGHDDWDGLIESEFGDDLPDPGLAEEGVGDEAPEGAGPGLAQPTDAGGQPQGSGEGPSDPAPGGSPAGTSPGAAPPSANVGETRGVTDDEILIGVAIPDLGAFTAANPEWDIGDMREQMDALLDGWRRSGALPLHGRQMRFVYRDFDILSSESEIAACRGFVEDDKVFAVISSQNFGDGAECVTERYKTPFLTVPSAFGTHYERGAPYYFTIRSQFELLLRNWMAWADTQGLLKDRTIGLYYEDDWDHSVDIIRQELARRGYEIRDEVAITSSGQMGAAQAPVAVRRLQAAGVDLVIPIARAVAFLSFTTQAESQMYRPKYILTETSPITTDAGMGPNPDNQVNGVYAMTQSRVGEIAAGRPVPRETQECLANYERYSGKDIGYNSPETAEYDNLRLVCDLGEILLRGLQSAGPALGHRTLVQGWRGISNMALAGHGNISFTDRPFGALGARTIQWSSACRCWHAKTGFSRFHY